MSKGIRDLSLSFGAKIITLFSALGIQICLAWFLGTSGRGSYAVCILFSALLATIFSMGGQLSSIYFVSSKRFSLSEGVIYTLIYGGVGSILAILTGWVLMQFPLSFFEKANKPELYLALASIPFFLYSIAFSQLFTAIGKFGWFSAMTLLRGGCLLLLTPIFISGLRGGTPGAILAIISSDLIVVMVCLSVFRRKFGLSSVHLRVKKLLAMLHYGARYCIGVISNQMNFRIGTMILAFFASKAEIGIYALAVGMTIQMQILPDAVKTTLIPRSARDQAGRKDLVAQCARLTMLASFFMLMAFVLLAKPIMAILFPPSFAPAGILIQILAFGFFLRTVGKSLEPYLIGSNRPGIISLSVSIGMIINIVFILLLLPRFGLAGAAWGVVFNYLVSSVILVSSFVHLSKISLLSTLRLRSSDFGFLSDLKKRFFPKKGLNQEGQN